MNEVICVNADYKPDQIVWFLENGIQWPKLDQMLTIRSVVRHMTGQVGLRFEEIHNPVVPQNHGGLEVNIEQTFHVRRFAHLNGDIITEEEIKEIIKDLKTVKHDNSSQV